MLIYCFPYCSERHTHLLYT